ncbi:MAG TPA: hypothetical protein VI454_16555 [Verrucomicrobiae bacterium]|jgi:hypothetical protein
MNRTDESKTGLGIYVIAALGALLIMAILVGITRKYTAPAPLGADRAALRRAALIELRGDERKQLTEYGVLDPAKGLVRLPIERAIEIVVQNGKDPAALRALLDARVTKANAKPVFE